MLMRAVRFISSGSAGRPGFRFVFGMPGSVRHKTIYVRHARGTLHMLNRALAACICIAMLAVLTAYLSPAIWL